MKSFEGGFLDRLPVGHDMLRAVARLAEYKGKEALFKEQSPQALETLRQTAIIQSTESSNRIEGVTAPLKRIQAIVREKTTPRNRSEGEIAGYRDVLNTIHGSHEHIPFTTGVVLQFHRDLFKYTDAPGGTWKSADNTIEELHPDGTRIVRFRPAAAVATPEHMEGCTSSSHPDGTKARSRSCFWFRHMHSTSFASIRSGTATGGWRVS